MGVHPLFSGRATTDDYAVDGLSDKQFGAVGEMEPKTNS